MKVFVVVFTIFILNAQMISAAKKRKQGSATTRAPKPVAAPAPAQAPNQDAAKLSYGNQGPPPPQAGWNTNNQHPQGPPPYQAHAAGGPPPYQPQGGFQQPQGPPPPYQQGGFQQSQPGNFQQPGQQQPVIINHVQQPQSSGGIGAAGGLAIGKLMRSHGQCFVLVE